MSAPVYFFVLVRAEFGITRRMGAGSCAPTLNFIHSFKSV
jgi:hypothetical protein